jgi:hypothetical protein
MKQIILGVAILFSFSAMAQEIKSTEVDKFNGKRRVLTENLKIYGSFLEVMEVKFRTVDSTVFISISGNTGIGVVGTDDAATFLFDDKSTLDFYPTSIQSYEISGKYNLKSYNHQYYFTKEKLHILATKNVVAIRRTFNKNYADFDIKEKHAKKLKELALLVEYEMERE